MTQKISEEIAAVWKPDQRGPQTPRGNIGRTTQTYQYPVSANGRVFGTISVEVVITSTFLPSEL